MKSKLIDEGPEQTYMLVFEPGEEAATGLAQFARQHRLSGARFTAIGGLERAVIGFSDFASKEYLHTPIDEQVEVLSLVGNIADSDGTPKVHAHVVVGKRDGTAHGGHLIEGIVRPTLEVVIVEAPRHLRRRFDPATGLALLSL